MPSTLKFSACLAILIQGACLPGRALFVDPNVDGNGAILDDAGAGDAAALAFIGIPLTGTSGANPDLHLASPDTHASLSDAQLSADARLPDAHVTDARVADAHVTDARVADARVADAHAPPPDAVRPPSDSAVRPPDLNVRSDLAIRDAAVPPPKPLHVLFIGDSYTYVGDLPGTVHTLSLSEPSGPVINVDSVAVGGATLKDQYTKTGALTRIRAGGWTHVVLQGQSEEPIIDSNYFEQYAKDLGDEVNKVGALPVFYETWARRAGNVLYTQIGGDPPSMFAALHDEYNIAATSVHGIIAKAGDGFELAINQNYPQTLYATDGSHPSTWGVYLTACITYRTLTGRSAVGLGGLFSGMTAAQAKSLQQIADQLVEP